MPKNNSSWWREKLLRNVGRDREKDAKLEALGWQVVHAWEHENPIEVADHLQRLWLTLRGAQSTGEGEPF